MKILQETISKLFSHKAIRHVFFCVVVLLLFLIGIITNAKSFITVAPRGIAVYLFFMACVYSGRWLFKRLPNPKKNIIPVWLSTTGCIAVLTLVCKMGISFIFHPVKFIFLDLFLISLVLVLFFLFIGISITIFYTTFLQQLQNARIAEEQKQGELNLLQSQLSPHFLFNTLNNIYSLSITQQKRLPGLLLKLSDLLRYSIYDTKNSFVLLVDEVNYIKNYIVFEKLRIGERLLLRTNIDKVDNVSIKIAPMLLIVFIENAFKHSKNTIDNKIEIDIKLIVKEDYIWFCIKNTYGVSLNKNNIINESSGLGLTNTIKRLQLLYPEEYIFSQNQENGYYVVMLQLKIR